MECRIRFGLTPEAAILTTSGVARVEDFRAMSQALVEQPATAQLTIFYSLAEAVGWLQQQPLPMPAGTYA